MAMTETKIRELAEAYIDEAVADDTGGLSPEERETAVEQVEAATRKLLVAKRENCRETVG
jgi:hypothetical protein